MKHETERFLLFSTFESWHYRSAHLTRNFVFSMKHKFTIHRQALNSRRRSSFFYICYSYIWSVFLVQSCSLQDQTFGKFCEAREDQRISFSHIRSPPIHLSDARLSLLVSEDPTTSSWIGAAAAAQLARSKSAEALSSDQDAEEVGIVANWLLMLVYQGCMDSVKLRFSWYLKKKEVDVDASLLEPVCELKKYLEFFDLCCCASHSDRMTCAAS